MKKGIILTCKGLLQLLNAYYNSLDQESRNLIKALSKYIEKNPE